MAKEQLRDKLYSYFVSQHGVYEYRRGWFRAPVCPFCGRQEKFSVNPVQDRARCFRCDYDNRMANAVQDIENLKDFKAVVQFIKGFKDVEFKEPKYIKAEEREVVLPDGFRTLRVGDSTISQMARNYVEGRGFDYKVLSRLGVGYTIDADSKYFGYLIVPFRQDNKVIYFQTRRFFGVGPKFNNPLYEDFGIGKNQIIYNSDVLKRKAEVSVLESWTNAWTLGGNSVSLNGKTLSPKQLSIFLGAKSTLFNILLDRDAWEYSLKIAFELIMFKPVRVVEFEDDRDVNDLGMARTIEKIDKTPIIQTFGELVQLKNQMKRRYAKNSNI